MGGDDLLFPFPLASAAIKPAKSSPKSRLGRLRGGEGYFAWNPVLVEEYGSSGAKPFCLMCGLALMFVVAVKNDILGKERERSKKINTKKRSN